MIGSSRDREAIRSLQEETAALQVELTSLRQHLADLSSETARHHDRLSASDAGFARLDDRTWALEKLVVEQGNVIRLQAASLESQAETIRAQAEAMEAQAASIATIRDDAELDQESVRHVRGRMERIERQAKIDMEAMRQLNAAIAASVLLKPSGPAKAAASQSGAA